MHCPSEDDNLQFELMEYAAGRAAPEQSAELEEHTRACPRCCAAVEGHRALWKEMENWRPDPPARDFEAAVMRRIRHQPAPVSWWRKRWTAFAIPAAAASVLALATLFVQPPPVPVEPPHPTAAEVEQALDDLEMLTEL